jgi:MFS family permease
VIILISALGALLACGYLTFFAGESELANFIGIFVFGAFAMPLYSLCSAHANDHAAPGQHALISAGTLFFWSVGAVIGPLFASFLIDIFGPHALFAYMIVVLTFFVAYTVARIFAREAVPTERRRMRFRSLLRTSTFFSKLAAPPSEKDGG